MDILPGVYAGLITKVNPTTNTTTNNNTIDTIGTGSIDYSIAN